MLEIYALHSAALFLFFIFKTLQFIEYLLLIMHLHDHYWLNNSVRLKIPLHLLIKVHFWLLHHFRLYYILSLLLFNIKGFLYILLIIELIHFYMYITLVSYLLTMCCTIILLIYNECQV